MEELCQGDEGLKGRQRVSMLLMLMRGMLLRMLWMTDDEGEDGGGEMREMVERAVGSVLVLGRRRGSRLQELLE